MSTRIQSPTGSPARDPAAPRDDAAEDAYPAGRGAGRFERRRAPFSLRCGALLVDYTVVIAILAFATLLARLFGSNTRWAGTTVVTIGSLAAAAVAFLNLCVLASFGGRTFGKWVTGLRIERRDGVPLSLGRSCLRHLVGYALTLCTLGLGFLVAAFNLEGRALHDYVAGTVVVRDRPDARLRARSRKALP